MASLIQAPSEQDAACGLSFLASKDGSSSHAIVKLGMKALVNSYHRTGVARPYDEGGLGDGVGWLQDIPVEIFQEEVDSSLKAGDFGVAGFFLPQDPGERAAVEAVIENVMQTYGATLRGVREHDQICDDSVLNTKQLEGRPHIKQFVFDIPSHGIPIPDGETRGTAFDIEKRLEDMKLEIERKLAETKLSGYCISCSHRDIVYKGMLRADQLEEPGPDGKNRCFFKDPYHAASETSKIVTHGRYATNSFASNSLEGWSKAHPHGRLSHNGEVNTDARVMRDGEAMGATMNPNMPDSAHAAVLIDHWVFQKNMHPSAVFSAGIHPPPDGDPTLSKEEQEIINYMRYVQGVNVLNGPQAFYYVPPPPRKVIKDGLPPSITMISQESYGFRPQEKMEGVYVDPVTGEEIPFIGAGSERNLWMMDPEQIHSYDLIGPGETLRITPRTAPGQEERPLVTNDQEMLAEAARRGVDGRSYTEYMRGLRLDTSQKPDITAQSLRLGNPTLDLATVQNSFACDQEADTFAKASILSGAEGNRAMGDDTPPKALSGIPHPMTDLFTQQHAQVTNPPIDEKNEKLGFSTETILKGRDNKHVVFANPILDSADIRMLTNPPVGKVLKDKREMPGQGIENVMLDTTYRTKPDGSLETQQEAVKRLCDRALAAVDRGATNIIVSNRTVGDENPPVEMLLVGAAIQKHLAEAGRANDATMIADDGGVRDSHDVAMLTTLGGFHAVCPWMRERIIMDKIEERNNLPEQDRQRLNTLYKAYEASKAQQTDEQKAAYKKVKMALRKEGISQEDLGFLGGDQTVGDMVQGNKDSLTYGLRKAMARYGVHTFTSYVGAKVAVPNGIDVLGPEEGEPEPFTQAWAFEGMHSPLRGLNDTMIEARSKERHEVAKQRRDYNKAIEESRARLEAELAKGDLEEGRSDEINTQLRSLNKIPELLDYGIIRKLNQPDQDAALLPPGDSLVAVHNYSREVIKALNSRTGLAKTELSGLVEKLEESIAALEAAKVAEEAVPGQAMDDLLAQEQIELLNRALRERTSLSGPVRTFALDEKGKIPREVMDNWQVTPTFKQYAETVQGHNAGHSNSFADCFGFEKVPEHERPKKEEMQPISEIVKAMVFADMSFGALTEHVWTDLVWAAQMLGTRSLSGEGGVPLELGEAVQAGASAVQVLSTGRHGSTPATWGHLNAALATDNERNPQLGVKMAQGAKPGEGGHLPGHKVDGDVAATRHATPGADLISPPPNHDIYSIEELYHQIHMAHQATMGADVAVKLVSTNGVGTVAAGVVKAGADKIQVSGGGGGTGSSPQVTTQHTGGSWEQGLAETVHMLLANQMRDSVEIGTDGGMNNPHRMAVAFALGADYIAMGTPAMQNLGCTQQDNCNIATGMDQSCSVGVAANEHLYAPYKEHLAILEAIDTMYGEDERAKRGAANKFKKDPTLKAMIEAGEPKEAVVAVAEEHYRVTRQVNVERLARFVLNNAAAVQETMRETGCRTMQEFREKCPLKVNEKALEGTGVDLKPLLQRPAEAKLKDQGQKVPFELTDVNKLAIAAVTPLLDGRMPEDLSQKLAEIDPSLTVNSLAREGNTLTGTLTLENAKNGTREVEVSYEMEGDTIVGVMFGSEEKPFPLVNTDLSAFAALGPLLTRHFRTEFHDYDERRRVEEPPVKIHTNGNAGQYMAALAAHMQVTHTGTVENSAGIQIGNNAILAIKRPEHLKEKDHIPALAGNNLGMGGSNGKIVVDGLVGDRAFVVGQGAVIVTEGSASHMAEHAKSGSCINIGPAGNNLGASGAITIQRNDLADYPPGREVANDNFAAKCTDKVNTYDLTTEKGAIFVKDFLIPQLEEFHRLTGSEKAGQILETLNNPEKAQAELKNWHVLIPKGLDVEMSRERVEDIVAAYVLNPNRGAVDPAMKLLLDHNLQQGGHNVSVEQLLEDEGIQTERAELKGFRERTIAHVMGRAA